MVEQTEDARAVMVHPSCPPERRLALTVGDSTQRFVPEEDYESLLDAYFDLRRTVALAHTHLVFGGEQGRDQALARIQAGTGLAFEDARAMQSILISVANGSLREDTEG